MKRVLVAAAIVVALAVAGCETEGTNAAEETKASIEEQAQDIEFYHCPDITDESCNTELRNYNESQRIYTDPTTILWCSVLPQSNTIPAITVPVTGKLTSSTTSGFAGEGGIEIPGSDNGAVGPKRSVDGLYHTNPPQYRYGFTPGGQYVDFFNLPTFCTTEPLEIQRKSVSIDIDDELNDATSQASEALKNGDNEQAQQILEAAANG